MSYNKILKSIKKVLVDHSLDMEGDIIIDIIEEDHIGKGIKIILLIILALIIRKKIKMTSITKDINTQTSNKIKMINE